MLLIYPESTARPRTIDTDYLPEAKACQKCGLSYLLISPDGRIRGDYAHGQAALYRGWMMTVPEYEAMYERLSGAGLKLVTSPDDYRYAHHLPNWYADLKDFTARTLFYSSLDDVRRDGLPSYDRFFVKDYVKSLTTRRGSIADDLAGVVEIVQAIQQYRGRVEGGICIREFEAYKPETEDRFFCWRGHPYARNGDVPNLVRAIADIVRVPFCSIDVIQSIAGDVRLVEIGDGQVSDIKRWDVLDFARLMQAAAAPKAPDP